MNHFSAFDQIAYRAAHVLVSDHLNAQKGETVLITTDTRADPSAARLLFMAAQEVGARPMSVLIPQVPLQGKLADPYLSEALRLALAASDCWIDLTHPYLVGSAAHDHAIKSGRVRCIAAGGLDTSALSRLYGGVALDPLHELQMMIDTLIADSAGKECRVTDDNGTDVVFVMAKSSGAKQRRAVKSGATYSLPGSAVMYPELESVRGKIVIVAAMHDWYGKLNQSLTLEVDGQIKRILEEGPEAMVLDRALRRAGGGNYGHVIHFSYGFHPAARWRGDCFVEDIRTVGANAIGFGKPWWVEGGGENHPDGVLLRQNLWIDGRSIIREGVIAGSSEMAKLAQRVMDAAAPK